MIRLRRKGVAIVDTDKGILLVAGRSKKFMLPGDGAKGWESRKKATIRELYEETGLKTKRSYNSPATFIKPKQTNKANDHQLQTG